MDILKHSLPNHMQIVVVSPTVSFPKCSSQIGLTFCQHCLFKPTTTSIEETCLPRFSNNSKATASELYLTLIYSST